MAGPKTGKIRHIPLGQGSAPHGVIVGPDGATWITDSGLNAIVRVVPRVDNKPEKVEVFSLPQGTPNINLNTATFDNPGIFIFHSLSTDTDLMLFAFRFLRQTMFGEEAIIMKSDAFEKRLARKKGWG